MITKLRSDHYIFIKQIRPDGTPYYNKFECYNPEVYSKMMEREFKM